MSEYNYYQPSPLERVANRLFLEVCQTSDRNREQVLKLTLSELHRRLDDEIKSDVELIKAKALANTN